MDSVHRGFRRGVGICWDDRIMDADFMRECDNAPRLNQLERFFSTTAAGVNGKPMSVPKVDKRLLSDRDGASRFIDLFVRRMGKFDEHYYTSIPYRLEEECRLGHALLAFAAETSTAERPFFLVAGNGGRNVGPYGRGTRQWDNQDSRMQRNIRKQGKFF